MAVIPRPYGRLALGVARIPTLRMALIIRIPSNCKSRPDNQTTIFITGVAARDRYFNLAEPAGYS
ncbi:MAG: hypothetical protein V1871_08820 [Planctomycetota bacterium]